MRQSIKTLKKIPLGSRVRSREKIGVWGLKKIILPHHLFSSQGAQSNWRPCLPLCRSSDQLHQGFQYSDGLMSVGRHLPGPVNRAGLELNWQIELKRWVKVVRKNFISRGREQKHTDSYLLLFFFLGLKWIMYSLSKRDFQVKLFHFPIVTVRSICL